MMIHPLSAMPGAIDKVRGFDHKSAHREPTDQRLVLAPPGCREERLIKRRHIIRLSLREYLPMLTTIGLWAVIVAAIGHADAARLLAATVIMRAVQMLTRLTTATSLKARIGASSEVRRQSRRFAFAVQCAVLAANFGLLLLLVPALDAIGQDLIAAFLPLIAVGLPARVLRYSDVRTDSPYFRLALAGGGLVTALAGWAAGLGAIGIGLAFGAREWIAYAVIRWWPREPHVPTHPIDAPLDIAEVARNTAISGRRLLTYRLTKVALTIFGPVGNLAARTGRGLNWHSKIEPYLPHKLSGFILFALGSAVIAVFLAMRSGEPAAMIGAAGLMQLAAASASIALMWRYLPDRDDPSLIVDEDDDE
jgi:hypothetical protein